MSTIQSFLALKVTDDYKTGTSKLSRTAKWMVHKNIIVFIDEAPMVDSVLLNFIREGLHDCKIVYVGDREQLAPVTEQLSRIYSDNLPTFELTEPMRNAGQPALLALCSQIRESVKTKEFFPITPVPGVVDIILDENQMIQELEQAFLKPDHNNRVLAYTNKCVVSYNDFIRSSRNLPPQYTLGERLVLGSALQLKDCILPVEEEFSIDYMSPEVDIVELPDGGELEVRNVTLRSIYNDLHSARMPVNREHYFDLIKYYQKQKAWPTYFMLKNKFPDLRPLEASTVHKAQGSTYDTVFIDATNLSSCHLVDQAARLLYVAVTRARHRVVFYGNLAEKYGGYNLE